MDNKQQHIITVAKKMFSAQGFSATSVRAIAQEAGINLSMISYYFGGKEGLLEAIIRQNIEEMRLRLDGLLQNNTISPVEKLSAYVNTSLEKQWEKRIFIQLMNKEQHISSNKSLNQLLCEFKEFRYRQFAELINQGQKTGDFRSDVNVPLLHATLEGVSTYLHQSGDFYYKISALKTDKKGVEQMLHNVQNHIQLIFKHVLHDNSKTN